MFYKKRAPVGRLAAHSNDFQVVFRQSPVWSRRCGRRLWIKRQLALVGSMAVVGGCWRASDRHLIVYCALDREFAAPLLKQFARETGLRPRAKYDAESTKTVGLVQLIMAERRRPRCDLFWNNEVLHTIRLARLGLLRPLPTDVLRRFPTQFRSTTGDWCGFAARARVLVVNRELLPRKAAWPKSVHDLTDAKWCGRVAVARPIFGTSATHAAVLHAAWGAEACEEFYRQVHANCAVLAGNRQVATAVARAQYAWGVTDTDDAWGVIRQGFPVNIVYPDQAADQAGTLLIPNTIALIRHGDPRPQAERLARFLLTAEVEDALRQGPSRQIPLGNVATESPPMDFRAMPADFERAADQWPASAKFLREEFAS